jgi:type I restriction enzyme S subunit
MGMDGYVASHLATIEADPTRVDSRFLLYFLATIRTQNLVQDQNYPSLNLPAIKGIPIPVPPLPEQCRIIAILDKAFEGIATAKANAEKSLRNAREAFASELEQKCGAVKEGWRETTVGQAADEGIIAKPFDGNHGEIHPKRADYTSSGVPFVMACDLKDGQVDTENCTFISPHTAERLRVGRAKSGDVLLSHKGTIGRTAVLSTTDDYVMLTPQVTSYRILDQSRLLNKFLYYYFRSNFFQRVLAAAAADGSTRAYVGITKQRCLPLRIPSVSEQKAIVSSLAKTDIEVARLEQNLAKKPPALDELKASLLHQAFSGDL